MATLFTNDYVDEQLVGDAIASGSVATGLFNNCSVGLCTTTMTYNRQTSLASLIAGEPTYAGYARKTVTWNAASRDAGGAIQSLGIVPEFRPTNGTVPATVQGMFIILSNSSLGGCGTLDDAPLGLSDQFSNLVLTLAYKPTSGGLISDLP